MARGTTPTDESAPNGSRTRSNADSVFDSLRADILGGIYEPGSRLKFASLSERYGASVSVLREALARLAEQRLVLSEPRVGFRVTDLSAPSLKDLTWTRIEIESLALRRAVATGDISWESTVLAAHHKLDRTPMFSEDSPQRIRDEWELAHGEFHRALVAGCGSEWLISIAANLRDCAELYRRWSGAREPKRDVAAEHRRLLNAVIDRDGDAAAEALTFHYESTARILLGDFAAG
ncbi:GntR family transcriptional regulator [Streptomyces sp. NPDC047081]|uniref:GntR family transcriptional regulator n=1 Tax=Streptomyces sp. NPDC047081 TaxID=3154706 RepID=UPI0033C2CAD9